ncbi:hypothetical protein ES288_A04G012000v1 [Gossypium darwinii]|uniref:Ataxin 2 SM domain-containing protein n=1 Tax=Gossypium darwinii TaxID=34276 RepID=A0A5D2GST3_GOSDA|nr:hypothetical protein ES288_A04G012000v1 [Gossypium darwinii]
MELKNRVEEENCLMNEALLLATMYILGLPVDMHLTDGSVYSGIFHTAAVEKEFGGFCFFFFGGTTENAQRKMLREKKMQRKMRRKRRNAKRMPNHLFFFFLTL